ncbi:MAG: DUF1902 domain-containing protein [Defluviitaleaceae bacterium]|nr:DUF1902 domain-containing protein [Defluviitaleaceae bacterium]
MRTCKVKMIWDNGIWYSSIDDEKFGLTLESGSFDALVERVRMAVREMFELSYQYTGPVQLIFETERMDVLKGLDDGKLYTQSQEFAIK